MRKCQRIQKIAKIWDNSLTVIGILGVLVLLLSYFLTNNKAILLFGQILVALSFCVVCFFSWMILLRKEGGTMMLLIFLGSGGTIFGLISQIMLDQVSTKPPTLNMAGVLFAIGVIIMLNKKYNVQDIRSEV